MFSSDHRGSPQRAGRDDFFGWGFGRPLLASAEDANKIIDDLIKLSSPLGTKTENRNGIGYVVLPP